MKLNQKNIITLAAGSITVGTLITAIAGFVASNMALNVPTEKVEELLKQGKTNTFEFEFNRVKHSIPYYILESEDFNGTCVANITGLGRAYNNASSLNLVQGVNNIGAKFYSVSAADGNKNALVNGTQEYGGQDEIAYLKAFITELVEKHDCKVFHFVAESLATPQIVKLLNDSEFKEYLNNKGVEIGVLVLNSPLFSLVEASGLKLKGLIKAEIPIISDAILRFGFFFAQNKTGIPLHTAISVENLNLANIANKVIVNVIKDDPTTGDDFVSAIQQAYQNSNDVVVNLYSAENGIIHPATTQDPKIYALWLNEFINQVENYSNNLKDELTSDKLFNKERVKKNNLFKALNSYLKSLNDFFETTKPLVNALASIANNPNVLPLIEINGKQYYIVNRGAFGIEMIAVENSNWRLEA